MPCAAVRPRYSLSTADRVAFLHGLLDSPTSSLSPMYLDKNRRSIVGHLARGAHRRPTPLSASTMILIVMKKRQFFFQVDTSKLTGASLVNSNFQRGTRSSNTDGRPPT